MTGDRIRVGIVGGSGYGGGELLRLLLQHPHVDVQLVTSNQYAGKRVHVPHPNLRGVDLKFQRHEAAEATDVDALFLAGPHGSSAPRIRTYLKAARRVFDLSADFRLSSPDAYRDYYNGWEHPDADLLAERAYGIAELHRDAIRHARLVSGAGCVATASILGLAPLARAGVIADDVIVDAKVGSSAAGATATAASHHPERRDVLRTYAATGHRHTAEIAQETGLANVGLTCTSVELVRGILATAHVRLTEDLDERAIWRIYREAYGDEPFVRVVKERHGLYRYPEPKLVAGTNQCHVGFERDPRSDRVVVMSAIDNLCKGTAGAAVQNMNLAFGFEETTGLPMFGLHP